MGNRLHSWLHWLPWAEFCFNSSYQMALQATPFEVVYDRTPPPLVPYQPMTAQVIAVDHQLRDRDEFLAEVKEHLRQWLVLMKRAHDKNHRNVEFAVGDWVWLRLNQWPVASVRLVGLSKLGAKYYRPYQVLVKIGSVSYRL
jgi:hypothetical protein